MLSNTLISIYERDLKKAIAEIQLYSADEDLWLLKPGITNSGGNVALHLVGNIKHFFGAVLGGTGYLRERDLEFSQKQVSREVIIRGLEEAILVINDTLSKLTESDFQQYYPEEFQGTRQTTEVVSIYMLSHLNYHLGQINYHRRLLSD